MNTTQNSNYETISNLAKMNVLVKGEEAHLKTDYISQNKPPVQNDDQNYDQNDQNDETNDEISIDESINNEN